MKKVLNIPIPSPPQPSPAGMTCMTLAESQRALHRHNDTLARLERASRHAFSYAMGVAAGLGGILCLLNAALFVCLCKRARRQVGQGS